MSTAAQELANRTNAAQSTGPVTPAGKDISSRNAVTTALTGRTVLLPTDDLAAYENHVLGYVHQFRPATPYELGLVQSLADTDWRLQRIPHLLFALSTKGVEDFAGAFPQMDEVSRGMRIELETQLKYEKQFRNLQLQESRLQRHRDKAVVELQAVIRERDARRKLDLETASKVYLAAEHDGKSFDPADFGFEFSTDDLRISEGQTGRRHRSRPTHAAYSRSSQQPAGLTENDRNN